MVGGAETGVGVAENADTEKGELPRAASPDGCEGGSTIEDASKERDWVTSLEVFGKEAFVRASAKFEAADSERSCVEKAAVPIVVKEALPKAAAPSVTASRGG